MIATQMSASILGILAELRTTPVPGGRTISVYLDTGPHRIAGQAYLLAFRDGCRALREKLGAKERRAFEDAVAQAERYLIDSFTPTSPALAVFASGRTEYFHVVPLPAGVADEVVWDEKPRLEPIEELIDEYERIAVVLIDKERARLYSIVVGAIEEHRAFVDPVPGKHGSGDWATLAQKRIARHHEEMVRRHIQHTIRALMDLLRTRSFDRLIVGGPEEARAALVHHLPAPLRSRLAGTVSLELFASDDEVRRAVLAEAEQAERRDELAGVSELVEAAATRRVALGIGPTLEALNQQRVHRLFLPTSFARAGRMCPRCDILLADSVTGPCPACGGATDSISDLREHIVGRVRQQNARLETVSGHAATLLEQHGGLGAWTRY